MANPFLGKARLRLPLGVGQGVSGATEGSRLLAFPGMPPSAPLGKCLCCLGFLPLHLFWGVMPQVRGESCHKCTLCQLKLLSQDERFGLFCPPAVEPVGIRPPQNSEHPGQPSTLTFTPKLCLLAPYFTCFSRPSLSQSCHDPFPQRNKIHVPFMVVKRPMPLGGGVGAAGALTSQGLPPHSC